MLGLTRANDAGWTSPAIIGCFAGGTALLAAFVVVERRVRFPLVDLALFRSGTFVMACLTAFLFSAAVFGSQPYTSLFMQNFWGLTPLQAGLAFVPATALVALMMPVSGILGQKLGSRLRLIVIAGSLCVAVSFLLLLPITITSDYLDVLPAFLLRGLGIGLVLSATSLAVVSAAPQAKAGLASGTLTMSRNIGTAIGVALLGAIFLHHVDTTMPDRLAGAPPAQVARATAAAEHFVPAGAGELHAETEQVVVDGLVLLSGVAALLSLVAGAAAVFIRHRAAQPTPEPLPVSARGSDRASERKAGAAQPQAPGPGFSRSDRPLPLQGRGPGG
jgi:predicted MFS family arabinose efflux permease